MGFSGVLRVDGILMSPTLNSDTCVLVTFCNIVAYYLFWLSYIVNPRKLEHEFRMIRAGIPYTLL